MYVITADQVDSRSNADLVASALTELNRRTLTLPAERTAGDELQLVTADAATALDVMLDLTRTGRWSVGCGIGRVDTPLPASTREATGDAFVAARTAVDRAKRRGGRAAIVGVELEGRGSASGDSAGMNGRGGGTAGEPGASDSVRESASDSPVAGTLGSARDGASGSATDGTSSSARDSAGTPRDASAIRSMAPATAELQAVLELLLAVRDRRSDAGWELHDLLETGLNQAQAAERLGITPQAASRRAQVAGLRVESAGIAALSTLMEHHERAATGE